VDIMQTPFGALDIQRINICFLIVNGSDEWLAAIKDRNNLH
jgi:hypothetical protein